MQLSYGEVEVLPPLCFGGHMKKITLIHTVESVYSSFKKEILKRVDYPVEITSLVDEFLVTNAQKKGYFPPENKQKLYLDMLSAQAESPDVIVVTCSSLTPFVNEIRSFFDIPIVCIDERMCRDAAKEGDRIAVLATAPTTVEPTVSRIQSEADRIGKKVEIKSLLDMEAMTLLKSGDVKGHDQRLAELSEHVKDYDVIVLAQASMATAEDAVKLVTGKIVKTSPGSAISELLEILEG